MSWAGQAVQTVMCAPKPSKHHFPYERLPLGSSSRSNVSLAAESTGRNWPKGDSWITHHVSDVIQTRSLKVFVLISAVADA